MLAIAIHTLHCCTFLLVLITFADTADAGTLRHRLQVWHGEDARHLQALWFAVLELCARGKSDAARTPMLLPPSCAGRRINGAAKSVTGLHRM